MRVKLTWYFLLCLIEAVSESPESASLLLFLGRGVFNGVSWKTILDSQMR